HSILLLRASGDCLAQVRDWHLYGHMRYYGYRAPARLEAGDRVWLECNYDTSSRGESVDAGESFAAEACRLNLYATAAPGTPAAPE
ncbi:MAG TPA: hypothetical protein VNO33_24170, partial [Kofleriaceae bacterium]|nr:hypothetical protein [Kofleriaceae bacterium]